MNESDFREICRNAPKDSGVVRVVSTSDRTVDIVIDNPRKKNALSPHMMLQLGDVMDHPQVQKASVIVVRGEAGAFCSGGDLDAVRDQLARPGMGHGMGTHMCATLDALAESTALIIGILDGPALGGGAELLVACDEIYASPQASFGFVHARMGVSPGFGGGARLINKVGARTALTMMTTAKPLSGSTLEATGLVDHWSADPLAAARKRAAELQQFPPEALAGAVRVVRGHRRLPTAEGRANEAQVFSELWGGPSHHAALRNRK